MRFLSLTTALATLGLTASWNCYRICFYSPPKGRGTPYDPLQGPQYEAVQDTLFQVIRIMEQYPYEDVGITAVDGIPLRGRYYHFREGAPLMILCHGYRGAALRDCCGGHAIARELGFNALVIHQRAHGESGGQTITFGIRERWDVHSWIHWAGQRFGTHTPLVLYGLSMGAATVLMGCELGYPANVACIIADSPYSAPAEIIRKVCRDARYPGLIYPFIDTGARIFGRFRLDECTAEEAVARAEVPILLIHGEDDRLVPCEMSRRMASRNPGRVRLCTVPGAGHGLSVLTDPQLCEKAVLDFLSSIPSLSCHLNERKKSEK